MWSTASVALSEGNLSSHNLTSQKPDNQDSKRDAPTEAPHPFNGPKLPYNLTPLEIIIFK